MLKRALLGVSALALLAGSASAADLAYRYPTKAAVVPVQMFSWTGFYIGGNIGYAWGSNGYDYTVLGGPMWTYDVGNANGLIGGFQVGYNYQFTNNVVAGVEADLEFADLGNDNIMVGGPLNGGAISQSTHYYGTIRGRLGYAMDRFLPYITGGAAWAQTKYTDPWGWSQSNTDWGWTIGGGLEYAVTNNWTVKAEYLYLDLGNNDYAYTNGDVASTSFNMSTLKAGVNYKF